ncbi:hypothetical protein HMPREF1324_0112 [Rothia aeria F0474]|uniref:Uncharacterized protein n=1 Tax=Rothia aeria F0474 TaxID=1125724 RepID=I0US58_9MICC|nr:hypothetical protein HMPREF1324_0112 [Rothia aeria F0474]
MRTAKNDPFLNLPTRSTPPGASMTGRARRPSTPLSAA